MVSEKLLYKVLDGENDNLENLYQVRMEFLSQVGAPRPSKISCQNNYDKNAKHIIAITEEGGTAIGSLSLITKGEMPSSQYIDFPDSILDRPVCEVKMLSLKKLPDKERKASVVLGLMEQAFSYLKTSTNMNSLLVSVSSKRKQAIPFYLNLGFQQLGSVSQPDLGQVSILYRRIRDEDLPKNIPSSLSYLSLIYGLGADLPTVFDNLIGQVKSPDELKESVASFLEMIPEETTQTFSKKEIERFLSATIDSTSKITGRDSITEKKTKVVMKGIGVYLPGEPVPYDQIESVLGEFSDLPPRVKKMNDILRRTAKNLIGLKQCYFAMDPKTRELTESHASMAEKAIRKAAERSCIDPTDIQLIVMANAFPDAMAPPTTTMVQERLGIERCAEVEIHSNCTGISKSVQIALDSINSGRVNTVVVVYSQLSSAYLRSETYNQKKVKIENLLLRWFLSDSATAIILQNDPQDQGNIVLKQVSNTSVGGKLEPAMWSWLGNAQIDLPRLYENGAHHLSQNYKAVADIAPPLLAESIKAMIEEFKLSPSQVDHLVATVPSRKLITMCQEEVKKIGISPDKWFSNVDEKGYSGGSSIIIGLASLLSSNRVKQNQKVLCATIESSKWMVGGLLFESQ